MQTKPRQYKPMNRSDIILRIIAVLIALGVAVGGSLYLGIKNSLTYLESFSADCC